MLVGNVCLSPFMPWQNKQKTKHATEAGQEPGVFFLWLFFFLFMVFCVCLFACLLVFPVCVFFTQEIYLVLYFPSNILPNSYRQPSYILNAVIGEVAGLSLHMTWEEHSSARCAGAPCRNRSPQKPWHPPTCSPHAVWKGVQRERQKMKKKKVPVALSGEGVKKANRNQQPTKDKHSTKKLQGKFKHWGPHSRKLVTWVTSWNFTAKYPFFFLIWKDKLLAFLNNFNMFNGWKLSSNCSAYWIKC